MYDQAQIDWQFSESDQELMVLLRFDHKFLDQANTVQKYRLNQIKYKFKEKSIPTRSCRIESHIVQLKALSPAKSNLPETEKSTLVISNKRLNIKIILPVFSPLIRPLEEG